MATDPFEYAERFNPARAQRRPTEAEPLDPITAEIRRQRDRDIAAHIAISPPADQVARATRLARQAGVAPVEIEGDLDGVERAQNATRLSELGAMHPALGRALSASPRVAVTAQDDADSLGLLGRAWEGVKKIPGTLEASYESTGSALSDLYRSIDEFILPFANPSGGRSILDRQERESVAYTRRADAARPKSDSFVEQSILQGIESILPSLTAFAVGALTRSPGAAASVMGGLTGAPAYQEALAQGKGTGDALRYGIEQGGIEALTERLPAGAWLEALTKRTPFGKTVLRQLEQELPGEQVATALQDFSEWVNLNPDKPFSTYLEERPKAALATALGTISGTTAQVGVAHVVDRTVRASAKMADRAAAANEAKATRRFFDRAGKAAEDSKLRQRDPDAYAEVVRAQAEEAGVTSVFVPAEAVQSYMQSDSYDPDSDPFQSWSDQVEEAAASGGDVVLPIDFALGTLPGTNAWAAIKDDMRLSAGGMSAREAETFDEAMSDIMADLADQMAEQERETAANRTAIEKLTASITQKLNDAGFTPSVSRTQAELIAQRAVTRAARVGREITGNEYDQTEVRQVLPPALEAARKADATDLVIHAMRGGRPSLQQSGQTLLQWIAKRGGVNDTGGDIASMGGDKWHRGKVGQKKLIRPFDAQAAMGAVTGAGDYGLDSTLRAAIDAGFFPELANVVNEGGVSTLDASVLLDAIGEEIGGSPHYAEAAVPDQMRAAAEELRELLSERGLDPEALSDVELRQAIDQLQEAGAGGLEQGEVIATVTGTEIAPARTPLKRLRELTRDWYAANLRGLAVRSAALDAEVRFASPKKMLAFSADAEKLRAVPALKTIVERGELLSSRSPYDAAKEPTIKAYHRLGGAVNVGKATKWVEVTIREDANGNLFYDHVMPENSAAQAPLATEDKSGPGNEGSAFEQSSRSGEDFNLTVRAFSDGPRGRISFPATGFGKGPTIIELFRDRNLSTLLHETGHQWLEELRFDATDPAAPDQLKADWQAVEAWFAKSGHPIKDGVIPVDAHELWARGVERYLMEGKAPSAAMQRLFETFRGWLIAIYKTVARLKSPITPEIREVMDRLIATDEEIAAATEAQALAPLFKDAATAGLTGAEFDAYRAQVEAARGEANRSLLEKTMNAIRRREQKRYREAREGVEAEIAGAVDARPLYRALRIMKGERISRQWIVDEFGQDALALLPVRVPPIHKDGGAHPTGVAEMAGYSSGKEMIEALIGAEIAHRQAREGGDQRSMRDRAIQSETDEEMSRRYGDPLNDGSIEREALAAVHSEMQGEVIASEIRTLARSTGNRATPYRIARDWARGKVRGGTYANEASPSAIQRHARSVAKAGREAEAAMLKGDAEEAFRFKQQQMLSSALLAEAKAANDEVEAARKRMDKIARTRTSKSIDQEYLEQAHALLEAVDLRERTQKSLTRQDRWAEWSAAREAEGIDIIVPASFAETLGTTNWSRLPVETLLGLDEAVKQVIHLGRHKQTLLDNQEHREFEALRQEAIDGAGNISGPPPAGLDEPSWWEAIKAKVMASDAALLKMETVFDWLDGGNPNGVFNRIVFRPIAAAQGREDDMIKDYHGRIKALFDAVPAKVVDRWAEKVAPPFVDRFTGRPMRVPRQKIISMALNAGNAGNLQRLADGYGVNSQAIIDYLASELTAEEWVFVQGVWDTIETLWPEIEGMERRINGIAPEKVEATEIVTPHGTFRGGYFPAIYDTKLDRTAKRNQGSAENVLFEPNAIRATTRSSATKDRADKVTRPILLDLGVINRHLGEVIHDITHREAVMQAWRFLSDSQVQDAVDQALGRQITDQMLPWVKFVANSWAMDRVGNEQFGAFMGKLRANTTAVGMGLRATTMVTQIAGYANSVEVVGEAWMAKAMAASSAHPIETGRFVMERSAEVRNRLTNLDRDLRAELARINARNPATKAAAELDNGKKFLFYGIGIMDRMVVVPTWMAAYNKGLAEGMTEEDAGYAADKAVRQSQGAGAPKDLAAIQRGTGNWGQALKLMTMFYSFFSAQYQRERTLARDIRGNDVRRPRNVPRLAARAFWMLVVAALLPDLLKSPLGAGDWPEDEEWWFQWLSRKLLGNALGPLPVVRDLFEPAWNGLRGARAFNPALSPVQRAYDTAVNVGRDVGHIARGEDTKRATKNALELVGYTTGLVPGQVASAVQFVVDVNAGDADPDGFGEWIEGLTTGRVKED